MGKRHQERNIVQRLLGLPATKLPVNPACWTYADARIEIDLDAAPELIERGGALRLEGHGLPIRVLVIHGDDGRYHAFRNECSHGGRRLDPLPGTGKIRCCGLGKSTFDYHGDLISGAATSGLAICPVEKLDGLLYVTVCCLICGHAPEVAASQA